MATTGPATPRTQQRRERRMFSTSDDTAMMKQIQATHNPDGREVDVKPILNVIENILQNVADAPGSDGDKKDQVGALEEKAADFPDFEGVLESLAFIIHKLSCELSCKCSGSGDAHATTMSLLNILASYPWHAKVVLALAAFAVNFGEYWLVAQLCTSHPLANSVSLLKQLPDVVDNASSLKPQFEALFKLVNAAVDVTKCIVEFKGLPSQYISDDTPPMSVANAHIPIAVYWTTRSIVACASLIASLVGLKHEYISSTTEAWELSSLAHKVNNIHDHLKNQLILCYRHIDEKRHIEAFHFLVRLFETSHLDNMKILSKLINGRDELQPLVHGAQKTRVNLEVLRRKHVLLLISDLDLSHDEIIILDHLYKESHARHGSQYEVVWLPIIDRLSWNDTHQQKFLNLQSKMSWYSVHHPSIIEPAAIKFIREVWSFAKKPIVVALDPQGKVSSTDALHMIWIWGNLAFPFTREKEEALWKAETWSLELLVDGIDPTVLDWIAENRYICLYGGEDIEWIRRFTSAAQSVAAASGIKLEMVYVGKSNAKERMQKMMITFAHEKFSYYWPNLTSVWFFWARLESMLYSKLQYGKSSENDAIMQEVMSVLSYDGSDQGWAIFCRGSLEMARTKGDTAMTCLEEFEKWRQNVQELGFVPALSGYINELHTPHHCNRLILPGTTGGIPEKVVCAECGRQMEKYFMYRCCVE